MLLVDDVTLFYDVFVFSKVAADVPAAALDPRQANAFAEDVERHLEYG
jgi:hypothetical protein